MRKMITTVAAVMLAGAMAALAACGDKDSSSDSGVRIDGGANARSSMTAEEYASAYVSNDDLLPADDENVTIQISYDNSFWNEDTGYDELYLVNRYFEALNKRDIQAVLDCYYPGYLDSLCGDDTFADPEEFVSTYIEQLEGVFTEFFEVKFIDISNCQVSGDLEADSMFANRDETLKAAFGDEFTDKITDRKVLTVAGYSYIEAEGDFAEINTLIPEGIIFCVYMIDGKPYIF